MTKKVGGGGMPKPQASDTDRWQNLQSLDERGVKTTQLE